MQRINKTNNNLKEIWDDLDKACECMERAIEKICMMKGLSDKFLNDVENFDLFEIVNLKHHVEAILEEKGEDI